MKTITKKYTVYDFEDLKKDNELCNDIYQEFWLDDPNNINPWTDENLYSFKEFAETINMSLDYRLSNADYPCRGDYIKLDYSGYDYIAPRKRAERIANAIEGYKGTGYCFCEDLRIYAEKLVAEWHKDYSITDFCEDMQNRMEELWFESNRYHFSKENFLEMVEANNYEFDEDGNLV